MEKNRKFRLIFTTAASVLFSILVVFVAVNAKSFIKGPGVQGPALRVEGGATINALTPPAPTGLTVQGNVGIGSKFFVQGGAVPAYDLDVDGDINVTGKFLKNGVEFLGGSQWTDVATGLISYFGDIRVEGNEIISGPFGDDGKRAVLTSRVEWRRKGCEWIIGRPPLAIDECVDRSYSELSCPSGWLSGDLVTVSTGEICNSKTNQVDCERTITAKEYRSCLGVVTQ